MLPHHGQSSNVANSQVQPAEVQWLLSDGGQVWDGRAPLVHERQVSVHPQLPLWLRAHLVQPGDLLVGHGGHAGLLQRHRQHLQLYISRRRRQHIRAAKEPLNKTDTPTPVYR